MRNRWDEECDVLVMGYGGAGAVAAISAHDAGAKVLVLEKQEADTATKTNHTPSTRMSGGAWAAPTDPEKAIGYLEGMVKIANMTLDPGWHEALKTMGRYLVENTDYLRSIGVPIGAEESISPTVLASSGATTLKDGKVFNPDFCELAGSECWGVTWSKVDAKFRGGASLFKGLAAAVQSRKIPVMWGTPGQHLLVRNGQVVGVQGVRNGKPVNIKARRGVILTCGGFEFNEWMKENYLRVNPVEFYGNPGNTGDGVTMCMEIGASLWHMNCASWRVTMRPPGTPIAFATQRHEQDCIFVDKRGKRFTNEHFIIHAFGYELINYDCYAMCYPKVPCYWIFDEKRRKVAPLASVQGACNPPGGVMGDIHYIWSADNRVEIDRGWIMKANTIEDLGKQILADRDNNGLMSADTLVATVKRYNELCRGGKDLDFNKPSEWLHPLEDPPYYAMKLWPGGPNTQGGPKRNAKGQILRLDDSPIPRLYSAGELGSVWGMLYSGAGNLGECIAYGRIAGVGAAAEKPTA